MEADVNEEMEKLFGYSMVDYCSQCCYIRKSVCGLGFNVMGDDGNANVVLLLIPPPTLTGMWR
jgi:hypothetical protein